jgi:hypothetical protein
MEDVTIIIQGKIDSSVLERWVLEYGDWNVIVSTWSTENLGKVHIPKNWTLLQFPMTPQFIDIMTLQWQLQSTMNAFQYVKTPFLIKARGDEFYSNLHRFVQEVKIKSQQIICSDIFYRGLENIPFHISDHLIGGTTENIKLMFERTYDLTKDGWKMSEKIAGRDNSETYLGFAFVASKEDIIIDSHQNYMTMETSIALFEKWFDSFSVDKLSPFVVRYGAERFESKGKCGYNF